MISNAMAQQVAQPTAQAVQQAAPAASEAVANKISIAQIIFDAHIFVQLIMLLLLAGAAYAIYTLVKKHQQLNRLEQLYDRFTGTTMSGQYAFEMVYNQLISQQPDGVERLFMKGFYTFSQYGSLNPSSETLIATCREAMENALDGEEQNMNKDLPKLASIASASPYIGLVGTVFGIMNSFIGIASASNTSIANVAPGIAEALIATGVGLIAAISALLSYNYLTSRVDNITAQYEDFIDNFLRILLYQSLQIHGDKR